MKYQLVNKITNEIVTPHYIGLAPNGELYVDGMNVTSHYFMRRFAGIKNQNGVEIYEGDVAKGAYWKNGKEFRFIGQVKFLGTEFEVVGVKQYYGMHQELHPLYEVIGNIYNNPELLEDYK
jgi:uncharacterized phage protein (TIGR01671 family)